MELNESQKRAIEDLDSSLWVEASAGTGKTEVLTRRYIEILAERKVDFPHQILAFTFTEKASHEMKSRIFRFIQEKSQEKSEEQKSLPSNIYKANLHKSTVRTDILYWKKVRSDWQSVAISTIHSFCARLIREYAHELGQDSDFEIVQDSELLMELEIVLDGFLENGLRYGGFEGILEGGVDIFSLFSFEELRQALSYLVWERNTYQKKIKTFYQNFQDSRSYEENLWTVFLKKRERVLLKSRGFLENLVKRLKSFDLNERISDPLTEKLQKRYFLLVLLFQELQENSPQNFSEDMSVLYKELTFTKKDAENWSMEEYQNFLESFQEFKSRIPKFWFGEMHKSNRYLRMKVLLRIYEELQSWILKRGNLLARWYQWSILRYDDLQVSALEILRSEYGEEIRSQYRHILLDEAQDLDSIQIEILEALLKKGEDSLREQDQKKNLVKEEANSSFQTPILFMVGDLKQSIYGFRGAHLGRFKEFMAGVPNLKSLDLTWNYRSSAPLVCFANEFFSHWMPTRTTESGEDIEKIEKIEGREEMDEMDENEVAYPSLPIQAFRKEKAVASFEFFFGPLGLNSREYKTRESQWIAERVLSLVGATGTSSNFTAESSKSEKFVHEKSSQKIRFRDIALLFRSLTDIVEYEKAFLGAGIPYQVVETKNFYKREEILDALQFLFLIEEPFNELALCGVLRSLFCGISDSTLYWVFHREDGNRISGRTILDLLRGSIKHFQIVQREKELLASLYEILKEIQFHRRDRFDLSESLVFSLEKTQYWNLLSIHKQRGKKKKQNLEVLIQKIRRLEAKHWNPTQILSYLNFQSQKGEENAPLLFEEGDMVSILSIHRAKGLEFPVVILPNLDRSSPNDSSLFLWDPELGFSMKGDNGGKKEEKDCIFDVSQHEKKQAELLEAKRIFYVAVTRARDRLIVSGRLRESKKNVLWVGLWSDLFGVDPFNELMQWFKRSGNPKLKEYIESLQKKDEKTNEEKNKEGEKGKNGRIEEKQKSPPERNMIVETQSFRWKASDPSQNGTSNEALNETWMELFFHVPSENIPSENTKENPHDEKGQKKDHKPLKNHSGLFFDDFDDVWNRKKQLFQLFPDIKIEPNTTTLYSSMGGKIEGTERRKRALRSLSASGILVYEKCPRKFYYKFVERIRESSETQGRYRSLEKEEHEIRRLPLNMLGNIVHKILEKRELQMDSMDSILLAYLKIEDHLSLIEEKTHDQLKEQVKELVQKFIRSNLYRELQWSQKNYPIDFQSEFEFLYRIEDRQEQGDILFEGSIDKIFRNREGNWAVLDYKTTHFQEKENKLKQKIHEYQSQMDLYTLVASELFGEVQEGILHFLELDQSTRIPYSAGIGELKTNLLNYVEDLKNRLSEENLEEAFFPKPSRSNCFFCGYWNCGARNSI